jgi:PAS domain S-box-containing protein
METLKRLSNETITNSDNLNIQPSEMSAYRQLLTLIDNLEENFYSVDMIKNQVTHVSKACLKIYGYPRESFLADVDFWFKVIHPEDKKNVDQSIKLLVKGQKTLLEYRIVCQDGSVKWVSNKTIPTLDETGKVIRLDGYTTDISERKRAELRIEKYNILMYQISHDLRGPLNAAKNYIEIALNKVKEETGNKYLQKINESYNKLEYHILSLLDLGRLRRTEAAFEEIDLIPFVRNTIGMVEGIKGFEKVKFSTDIKITGELYSDRQYLQSIIYNLLSNAIKFRRNTTDSFINVAIHSVNSKTIISVSDNGMGIPQAIKCNVFDMFVKGGSDSSGNGLGLYIVKNLVEKLKGEISLESEENKGTIFTITLPINSISGKGYAASS